MKTKKKNDILEKKLNESINQLLSNERQLIISNNKNEMLSKENYLLKDQISYFETAFEDIKQRKQNEINELKRNLEELNEDKEELTKEKNLLQNELSELKLKMKLLEQENEIIKTDNEHMKQILDENSNKIKISDEKINSIDNLINLYKNTNNDLNREIEKIKQEKKIEKEENNKKIKDFENTLKEKDNMLEKIIEEIKNEYEQKINEQIEENENIRSKYVEFKIERDKYFGDLNILNDEYEKLKDEFQSQQMRAQNIKDEIEEDYKKKLNRLNDKIRLIDMKNSELDRENNELKIKMKNIFGQKYKDEKLVENGEDIYQEMLILKKENEKLQKKIEELENEKNI